VKIKTPNCNCAMCHSPNATYNDSDLCLRCQEGVANLESVTERENNPELRGLTRVVVGRGDGRYYTIWRRLTQCGAGHQ
jgi:hypothetical protein